MESSSDKTLRPIGLSVWCTRCNSNLSGTTEAITIHFKNEHGTLDRRPVSLTIPIADDITPVQSNEVYPPQ